MKLKQITSFLAFDSVSIDFSSCFWPPHNITTNYTFIAVELLKQQT